MIAPKQFKFAVNTHGCDKDWDFNLLSGKFSDRVGTIEDVRWNVEQGHALNAGLYGGKWRSKSNVIGSQWILLDIDNSDVERDENGKAVKDQDGKTIKVYRRDLTLEEAIAHPFVKQHCALIYTTASHRPDWHKFRMVFLLPELVEDIDVYESMVRLLMGHFPHDPSCKDASRVFYGSTQATFPLINPDACLPSDWQDQARAIAAKEKQERAEREQLLALKRQQFKQIAAEEGWNTDQLIQQALSYIPPRQPGSNNYDECRQVLMALVDHYGTTEAEIIAEGWSPSIKGTTWNICQKIKSFRRSGVTIGTLFHIAKQYGFRFPQTQQQRVELGAPNKADYEAYLEAEREQEAVEEAQGTESFLGSVKTFLGRIPQKPKRDRPNRRARIADAAEQRPTVKYVPGCIPEWRSGQEMPKFEYEGWQRHLFWTEGLMKGYEVVDTSFTGAGKSHAAGLFDPSPLAPENLEGEETSPVKMKTMFFSDGHRNPDTATVEANFVDVPVRHSGLVIDDSKTTPLGNPHLRHPRPDDGINSTRTNWNCINHEAFVKAAALGLDWASETAAGNPICLKCPFYGTCGQESSIGKDGQGFRAERARVFRSEQNLRLSMKSAPAPSSYPAYTQTVGILEESSLQVRAIDTMTASLASFDRQWADLEGEAPEVYENLKSIKVVLRPALKGEADIPRFGLDDKLIREMLPEPPKWLDVDAIQSIRDAICPTVEDVLGGEPDGVETTPQTEAIAKLKAKLKRKINKLPSLKRKLAEKKQAIAVHEAKKRGLATLADTAKTRALRDSIQKLESEVESHDLEIQRMEGEIEKLEEERELVRTANRKFRSDDRREALDKLANTPVQWLPRFLEVWAGITPGAIRINGGVITITTQNHRHNEVLDTLRGVIHLDATGDLDILSSCRNVSKDRFIVGFQEGGETPNLKIYQVKGFGQAGKQRAESTDQRINAAIAAITERFDLRKPAIIDHKAKAAATSADGAWFVDHRGSNRFKERDALINVGAPLVNLGAVFDEWLALGGDSTGIGFELYYQKLFDAELIQDIGRLRAARRQDELLHVFFVNDLELPFEAEQINAADLTIEAAEQGERTARAVIEAVLTLCRDGAKVTQQAIANCTTITQGRISQIFQQLGGWSLWKKIISLLIESLNRTTNNFSQQLKDLTSEEEWLALEWLPALVSEFLDEPERVAKDIAAIVKNQGWKSWTRIMNAASAEVKAGILAIALSFMPDTVKQPVFDFNILQQEGT